LIRPSPADLTNSRKKQRCKRHLEKGIGSMTKWKPKVGKYFWHFDVMLRPRYEVYVPREKYLYNVGNCFRTKKQCCEAIRKIKKILKESEEV